MTKSAPKLDLQELGNICLMCCCLCPAGCQAQKFDMHVSQICSFSARRGPCLLCPEAPRLLCAAADYIKA